MPPSDNQRAMMRRVLSTFLTAGKPTSREDLLREYPELDDLNDIVWRNNIFKVSYIAGTEQYLPSVWVFHLAGDEQAQEYARKSVQTLVKVLRAQFFSRRNELSRETLLKEAKGFEPAADASWIELGIYLGTEMNLFQGWRGGNPQQPQIEPTKISEQIVKATEPDKFWNQFTSNYKWPGNHAREAAETYLPSQPEADNEESAPKDKRWTRGDKIAGTAAIVGIAGVVVAALTVPEIRFWLRLDKPTSLSAPLQSSSPAGSAPASGVPSPSVPVPHLPKPVAPKPRSVKDHLTAKVSHGAPPLESKSSRDAAPAEVSPASTTTVRTEPQRVDWHDKRNWRQNLKVGMTEDQVRGLFGDPDHVSTGGNVAIWYYGEVLSRPGGRITFNDGVLFGWDEPN